jgi:hypothetical protein
MSKRICREAKSKLLYIKRAGGKRFENITNYIEKIPKFSLKSSSKGWNLSTSSCEGPKEEVEVFIQSSQ